MNFLLRHRWSLPLGLLSLVFFLRLAVEVRENELGPFDQAVASWLQAGRGSWDGTMLALTRAGSQQGMTIVCVSAVLLLALLKQRKASVFVAVCGLGALLLTVSLKLFFERARPEASVLYLIQVPSSFSFPSGHALGTTSVLGCLVVLARALRLPLAWRLGVTVCASALIAGVTASRVYFGVHYASDVLGGVLAGAAWVAAVTGWFYPRLLPGEASVQPV
jgi:undecaprenyl-diphosphatase